MELFLHRNITDATSYVISTSGKFDLHFIMQNTFVTSQERREVTLNCEIKLSTRLYFTDKYIIRRV